MEKKEKEILLGLEGIVDTLASIEHERWAHWQKYLHSKCSKQADGSLLIPVALVEHWQNQIDTDFADLDEHDRDSDREQVRKHLRAVAQALTAKLRKTFENWT